MFRSSNATLIISNEEMNDIMTAIKFLEESGLLIKKVLAQQLKMKQENKNEDFLVCY